MFNSPSTCFVFTTLFIRHCIERTDEWAKYVTTPATSEADLTHLTEALLKAFVSLDDSLWSSRRASGSHDSSGCTVNLAIVTPTHIICANVGDSRCVLSSHDGVKGKPTLLLTLLINTPIPEKVIILSLSYPP